MIDTIFKLIDTLQDGIELYSNNKKNLFDNYLEPALKDFENVHANYMSAFKKYLEQLYQKDIPLDENNPIFDSIKNDSLFSEDLRNKLFSYYDFSNNNRFSKFNNSIIDYFQDSIEAPYHNWDPSIMYSNIIRRELYAGLMKLISDDTIDNKSDKAIEQTKFIVINLQKRYRKVLDNFNSLKNELIN